MTRDELIEAMARAIAIESRVEICGDAMYRFSVYGPKATAALSAIEAAGFAIVPVVASDRMRKAGADNLFGAANDDWGQDAAAIYTAMIQAAQQERAYT